MTVHRPLKEEEVVVMVVVIKINSRLGKHALFM